MPTRTQETVLAIPTADLKWREFEKKKSQKVEISTVEFLAEGKACKAIFWPTPSLKQRIIDGSEFSLQQRTLISAATVLHCKEEHLDKQCNCIFLYLFTDMLT